MRSGRLRSAMVAVTVTVAVAATTSCTTMTVVTLDPAMSTPESFTPLEYQVERVQYPTRGDGDPTQNYGDFYYPTVSPDTTAVRLVVLIHGGGWKSNQSADYMKSVAVDLVQRGVAVYNIEYRRVGSGGGWPTTFTDVADAVDHLPELQQRYPLVTLDDELIVGHSAGGQLAAWVGTRKSMLPSDIGGGPRFLPTRVVSLAGTLDMTLAADDRDSNVVGVLGGTPDEVPDRYDLVDPIRNLNPGTPVIAIHGNGDTVVPITLSENYIEALDNLGGTGALVVAEGDTHGSVVTPASPNYQRIINIVVDASGKTVDELRSTYR